MPSMMSHNATNDLLRQYLRTDVIVVYKTKEKFGGLSNMASGFPVCVNDVQILTSEALYQACRFPHLPSVQREILWQRSPMIAKMKSKLYIKYSRPDWDLVRTRIMRWCLRVKLAQNYDTFGQLLLDTKDYPIVELSLKDDYWGTRANGERGEILIGQNVLGRLLMELRELLKKDEFGALKVVQPLSIQNFFLLGKPISPVTRHSIREADNQGKLFY